MNKQELIEGYERISNFCETISVNKLIQKLKQLDGPEKVTIPQRIAEKIEYCKETDGYSLFHAMDYCYNFKECADWLERNEEVFACAWLDGYEIKKERRYKVVMPNVSSSGGVLTRIKHDDSWIWIDTLGTIVEGRTHTRKQLEDADFGWVFDCPGVEIEEVD